MYLQNIKYKSMIISLCYVISSLTIAMNLEIIFSATNKRKVVTNITLIKDKKPSLHTILQNKFLNSMVSILREANQDPAKDKTMDNLPIVLAGCVSKFINSNYATGFLSLESATMVCSCYPFAESRNYAQWPVMQNNIKMEKVILPTPCFYPKFTKLIPDTSCADDVQLGFTPTTQTQKENKFIKKIEDQIATLDDEQCNPKDTTLERIGSKCFSKCKPYQKTIKTKTFNKGEIKYGCTHFCSSDENPDNELNLIALPHILKQSDIEFPHPGIGLSNAIETYTTNKALALESKNPAPPLDSDITESIETYKKLYINQSKIVPYCFQCPSNSTFNQESNECIDDTTKCILPFQKYDKKKGCIRYCFNDWTYDEEYKNCLPSNKCSPVLLVTLMLKINVQQNELITSAKDFKCDLSEQYLQTMKTFKHVTTESEKLFSKALRAKIDDFMSTPISTENYYQEAKSFADKTCQQLKNDKSSFLQAYEILTSAPLDFGKASLDHCDKECEKEQVKIYYQGAETCVSNKCSECYDKLLQYKQSQDIFEHKYSKNTQTIGNCSVPEIQEAIRLKGNFIESDYEQFIKHCLSDKKNAEVICKRQGEVMQIDDIVEVLNTKRFQCDPNASK